MYICNLQYEFWIFNLIDFGHDWLRMDQWNDESGFIKFMTLKCPGVTTLPPLASFFDAFLQKECGLHVFTGENKPDGTNLTSLPMFGLT